MDEAVVSKSFWFLFDPFHTRGQILLLVMPWFSALRDKYSWRCMNERLDPCPTPSLCSSAAGGKDLILRRQTALLHALSTRHTAEGTANPSLWRFLFPFLAKRVSLSSSAETWPAGLPGSPLLLSITCPMLLPGSCHPCEENELFVFPKATDLGFAYAPVTVALALLLSQAWCRTTRKAGMRLHRTVAGLWVGWRRQVRVGTSRVACALVGKVPSPWGTVPEQPGGESVICQKTLCAVSCSQPCNAEYRVRGGGLTLTFVALGWTVCPSVLAVSTVSFG